MTPAIWPVRSASRNRMPDMQLKIRSPAFRPDQARVTLSERLGFLEKSCRISLPVSYSYLVRMSTRSERPQRSHVGVARPQLSAILLGGVSIGMARDQEQPDTNPYVSR
jgi:hypothetical protein